MAQARDKKGRFKKTGKRSKSKGSKRRRSGTSYKKAAGRRAAISRAKKALRTASENLAKVK